MGEAAEKKETREQEWYTTAEAAEYCRMTPDTLRCHVSRGNIKPDSTVIRVECVAIKIGDVVYSLPRPNRHDALIMLLIEQLGRGWLSGRHEQGFVLSDGSYANRQRAAQVAYAAGQIKDQAACLISEALF